MARDDIRQPTSRIFAPQARQVAAAPSQETSASGTTPQQDFQRAVGAANQMASQYARTKVREQEEIDMADRHQYQRNKAKYVPAIKKKLEEQNLEGLPAETVMGEVQQMEEFGALFSGYGDTDNREKYQKNFLSEMSGYATEKQTVYEEQQRGRQFVEYLTSGMAEAKPGERGAFINQAYQDGINQKGLYKKRPEEIQEVLVGLAQQYNQAGQYDKAKDLVDNVKFDEGFRSQAGIHLTTATEGIEEERLEQARMEYMDLSYELHNDPELTEGQARSTVNRMDEEGLFQSAQQKEAHHDWLMSGQREASGRNVIFSLLKDKRPETKEGLNILVDGLVDRHGLIDKVGEQAKRMLIDGAYQKSGQKLARLRSNMNEDGTFDNPEKAKQYQMAYQQHQKNLKYVPLEVQTQMTDFANIVKNPDGDFDPEKITQYGHALDQVASAFGGSMTEALKTYFPGDRNAETRGRLRSMDLLREAYGGSWQMGWKNHVENRKSGPSAEHTSWQDREKYKTLMSDYENRYGTEYMPELKARLQTMKSTPMDAAFTAAVESLAADYNTTEESQWLGDKFTLKGRNGKAFLDSFKREIRSAEDFGAWTNENGQVDKDKEPYGVMRNFVERMLPEWERQFEDTNPSMDFEIDNLDDAFNGDGTIQIISHPEISGAIQIKHKNGFALAPQVHPSQILQVLRELPEEDRSIEKPTPY